MKPMPVARSAGLLVAAGLVAAAAACTVDSDGASAPSASPATATPSSPSPTPERVELALGEPASLTLQGGSGVSSRVRLAVTDVTKGRIRHLSDFRLDAEARRSTPYYATVRVTNTGSGNLSGERLTLWGLDSTGTVRPPADVVGTFPRCQHEPLPKRFTRRKSARTCLLFLLPPGTTLDAVQYRFNDRPPYSWPVR